MPRDIRATHKVIKMFTITILAPVNIDEDQLQVDRQYMSTRFKYIENYAKHVLDEYMNDYRVEIK